MEQRNKKRGWGRRAQIENKVEIITNNPFIAIEEEKHDNDVDQCDVAKMWIKT